MGLQPCLATARLQSGPSSNCRPSRLPRHWRPCPPPKAAAGNQPLQKLECDAKKNHGCGGSQSGRQAEAEHRDHRQAGIGHEMQELIVDVEGSDPTIMGLSRAAVRR